MGGVAGLPDGKGKRLSVHAINRGAASLAQQRLAADAPQAARR